MGEFHKSFKVQTNSEVYVAVQSRNAWDIVQSSNDWDFHSFNNNSYALENIVKTGMSWFEI